MLKPNSKHFAILENKIISEFEGKFQRDLMKAEAY
jgi:hypothetical protein